MISSNKSPAVAIVKIDDREAHTAFATYYMIMELH